MLQINPELDVHGDLIDEKAMTAIFEFLESRAYVFKQLGVGCFVKSPHKQKGAPLELHLYLQKKRRPLLYKGNPISQAVILLPRPRAPRSLFPWSDFDGYGSYSEYVTDAFNRILEHYQDHIEDYRLANEDDMAVLTANASYLTVLTPED